MSVNMLVSGRVPSSTAGADKCRDKTENNPERERAAGAAADGAQVPGRGQV